MKKPDMQAPLTSVQILNLAFLWFFASYVAFNFVPVRSLWFDPGPVRVLDADTGRIPEMEYFRTIKRETEISWNVVIRKVGNSPGNKGVVHCYAHAEPYRYRPVSGPLVGKTLDWWVHGEPTCLALPDGAYWMETCWTLTDPLGDLLTFLPPRALGLFTPTKTVCESTPLFYIGPRPPPPPQAALAP